MNPIHKFSFEIKFIFVMELKQSIPKRMLLFRGKYSIFLKVKVKAKGKCKVVPVPN
jgi:hypothetical protein